MKIEDIKLETCPFCDGEGEIIHSKPDEGYIYSESVYAFVKCKNATHVDLLQMLIITMLQADIRAD